MSYKVSIIVPVYNGENYLNRCIDSLLRQTLNEIEILIINDGSTDSTTLIIDEYQNSHPNIKIYHTQNNGVSAARNVGLQNATGEYIGFVDADDWVEENMYELMFSQMKLNQVDWVICSVNEYQHASSRIRIQLENEKIDVLNSRSTVLERMLHFNFEHSNWNKLYSAEIIKQNNLVFDTTVKIGEDLLFNLFYLSYSSGLYTVKNKLYNYQIHDLSVMANKHSRIEEWNLVYNKYLDFCNRTNLRELAISFKALMSKKSIGILMVELFKALRSKTSPGYFEAVSIMKRNCKTFDFKIFNFDDRNNCFVNVWDKYLLKSKFFNLFSFKVVSKIFARKYLKMGKL